jgi:thymidylate synthase (FAD)
MNTIKVLDHGFVKLLNISCAIDDNELLEQAPAISARISFDNFDEVRTKEQDMNLVEYLIKNHHNTPIEMTEVWLEMKLPIFVARQFVRHRTACINEVSGRYVTLPEEWYIPEVVGGKAVSNKQGQEDNLDVNLQEEFKNALDVACYNSYYEYKYFLDQGVAPEHARMFLHVNHYTHWVWKQDLSNLMHFLALRMDEHAQIEARMYATAIYALLCLHLPQTMELFDKYKLKL